MCLSPGGCLQAQGPSVTAAATELTSSGAQPLFSRDGLTAGQAKITPSQLCPLWLLFYVSACLEADGRRVTAAAAGYRSGKLEHSSFFIPGERETNDGRLRNWLNHRNLFSGSLCTELFFLHIRIDDEFFWANVKTRFKGYRENGSVCFPSHKRELSSSLRRTELPLCYFKRL